MGLMFQNEGLSYAMIILFTSNFSFPSGNLSVVNPDFPPQIRICLRPLNTNLESNEFDEEHDDFDDKSVNEFDLMMMNGIRPKKDGPIFLQ